MTLNNLGLDKLGITRAESIVRNPPVESLIEDIDRKSVV